MNVKVAGFLTRLTVGAILGFGAAGIYVTYKVHTLTEAVASKAKSEALRLAVDAGSEVLERTHGKSLSEIKSQLKDCMKPVDKPE